MFSGAILLGMKRVDLMKRIAKHAKKNQASLETSEGGDHTKVYLDGALITMVPRHSEINEMTAKGILRTVESWKK